MPSLRTHTPRRSPHSQTGELSHVSLKFTSQHTLSTPLYTHCCLLRRPRQSCSLLARIALFAQHTRNTRRCSHLDGVMNTRKISVELTIMNILNLPVIRTSYINITTHTPMISSSTPHLLLPRQIWNQRTMGGCSDRLWPCQRGLYKSWISTRRCVGERAWP